MAVTKAEAAKMKVAELKAALTEVGLPTNGRKADLLARLNAHIEERDAAGGDAMDVDEPSSTASSLTLRFDFVDVEVEKGVLTNYGDAAVSISGFTIQDFDGGNKSAPIGDCSIPAGKSINIWTCPGKAKGVMEDSENVFWRNSGNGKPRSAPVLNDEGDGLKLFDANGTLVASGEGRKSVHLRFDQVDVEAEFGILTNTGSSDVNLTGYTVQDLDGGNQSRPFGECSVAAGKSVTIWTCPGTAKGVKEDANNIFWRNSGNGQPRKQPVLNDEGDGLRLLDAAGVVVATGLGSKKDTSDAMSTEPDKPRAAPAKAAPAKKVATKTKKASKPAANGNGAQSDVPGLTAEQLAAELKGLKGNARKNKLKKLKKKYRTGAKEEFVPEIVTPASEAAVEEGVEIEYVDQVPHFEAEYIQFADIFEKFKPTVEVEEVEDPYAEDEEDEKEEEADEQKMSKKKLRKLNRLTVAQLKQLVDRPDLVEVHDVAASDPRLLIQMKCYRNTVPVPRHWCLKRKYLQGKRGIEKKAFELPDFIRQTGIMEMRAALQEQDDAKGLAGRMREKVRPKMGKMEIDYQKLHDAFFRFQTKPDNMGIHGEIYYEGREFETNLRTKKPGDLSEELKAALGMPTQAGGAPIPPPWLLHMQRYGPPPSYPNLKIPGLNAPIPKGASFGFQPGGWGKPPVDEYGRPIYGDVFGVAEEVEQIEAEPIDDTLWGQLESEDSGSSSDEDSSDEDEDSDEEDAPAPEIDTGLVTPGGMTSATPSGISSVQTGADTPDMIELRKRKNIEDQMDSSEEQTLYKVIPQKDSRVGGAMMGSAYTYDVDTGEEDADLASGLASGQLSGSVSKPVSEVDPARSKLKRKAADAKAEKQAKKFKF